MKKIKTFLKDFIKNEEAQGATEYILLLVAVVAVLLLFKDEIRGMVEGKIADIKGGMSRINVDN